eukprot:5010562-Pleurochrysis_carterae.AAC.1
MLARSVARSLRARPRVFACARSGASALQQARPRVLAASSRQIEETRDSRLLHKVRGVSCSGTLNKGCYAQPGGRGDYSVCTITLRSSSQNGNVALKLCR